MKYIGNNNKIFSIGGSMQSTTTLLYLSEKLFEENSALISLLTYHFLQDLLENLFPMAMANLLSFTTLTNCTEDDSLFLPVNSKSHSKDW